jgi:hypothetical protein
VEVKDPIIASKRLEERKPHLQPEMRKEVYIDFKFCFSEACDTQPTLAVIYGDALHHAASPPDLRMYTLVKTANSWKVSSSPPHLRGARTLGCRRCQSELQTGKLIREPDNKDLNLRNNSSAFTKSRDLVTGVRYLASPLK